MIEEVFIARDLKELWRRLRGFKGKVRYIAGGTDLVPNIDNIDVDMLVDISRVKELCKIELDKDFIFIGGGVKISELEISRIVKKYLPALYKAIRYYATPAIRNLATLGGNLANASPSADGVLALMALSAKVVLNLYNRRRILPIEDVVCDVKKTILREREIIEGFLVPVANKKASFIKIMPRNLFGIAKVGLCISADVKDGFFYNVRIACSSVAPKVILATNTALYLEGKKITNEVIERAKSIILSEISPITDHRSTKEYREAIIGVIFERAVGEILHD